MTLSCAECRLFLQVYHRMRSGKDAADLIPRQMLTETGGRTGRDVLIDIREIMSCEDRVYRR